MGIALFVLRDVAPAGAHGMAPEQEQGAAELAEPVYSDAV